jgi:hypothetical protein
MAKSRSAMESDTKSYADMEISQYSYARIFCIFSS